MIEISRLARNIVPSMTVELKNKISELQQQGIKIISLTSGEPDMQTPEHIRAAAKAAVDSGNIKYTPSAGIAMLREAICKTLYKDHGLEYTTNQICVSTGAKQALFNAVMAVCNPNDEVLLPTPCWVSYTEQVKMTGAIPVLVPMSEKTGYQIDADRIAASITEKTKLIILNNPNNPTGAVYRKKQLEKLAILAEQKNLIIISDEIYEKLIYDDESAFISFPTLSKYTYQNTILINGCSKTYAMTGWRLGYAAGPKEIIRAMSSIQGHITYNANTISQYAAIEAFSGPQDCVENMRKELNRRRIYVTKRLNEMDGIKCNPVQGAFYVLPNVAAYYGKEFNGKKIQNSLDFCDFMLQQAKIGLVPGDSYYAPDAVRISYTSSMEDLKEGLDRFEEGLSNLK